MIAHDVTINTDIKQTNSTLLGSVMYINTLISLADNDDDDRNIDGFKF